MNLNIFEKQKEFMLACSQSVDPLDDVEDEFNNYNEWYMWVKLINEEHAELSEAILHYNDWANDSAYATADIASEAIDLIYVTCGLLNNMGIDGMKVFNAIHKANMDKVGKDGKVLKNKDGKVLKPEGWKPADIRKIINESSE